MWEIIQNLPANSNEIDDVSVDPAYIFTLEEESFLEICKFPYIFNVLAEYYGTNAWNSEKQICHSYENKTHTK